MKLFIVISALVGLALADEFYHTGDDHLDVDEVMKDPVVIKRFIDCFIEQGPCDSLAYSYKVIMHDAIQTSCAKCSPSQKHMWYRFLWDLKQYYPEEYEEYTRWYDPEDKFIDALIKATATY